MSRARSSGWAVLMLLAVLPFATAAAGDVPVVRFFALFALMLVVGKVAGEAFERLRQPAVLGELLAGILLGRGALGIIPTAPDDPLTPIIALLAEVGVAILLFEIGLETDLRAMGRVGGGATAVALVGITAPFLLGFIYGSRFLPPGLTVPGANPTAVAVFLGAALTATSVGITARVLADLKQGQSHEARLVLGAAVLDDVLGLVILGVVSSFAAGTVLGALDIARMLLVAVGFLVVAIAAGLLLAPQLLRLVEGMQVRGTLIVAATGAALGLAALAAAAGSALIIGAFAAGIIFSGTARKHDIEERIRPVADLFTPVFFLSIGAAVDLGTWNPLDAANHATLLAGAGLIACAVLGKLASGWAAPWQRFNRLAVGVGMMPRGEVGLIFAQIGLTTGLLSERLFSAVLLMVIATTLLAPPLLALAFRRGGVT